MIIKGKNQHVMPSEQGWGVIDEADPMVAKYFSTQDEAMTYAQQRARACEGDVLVHSTPSEPGMLSSVALPLREIRRSPGIMEPIGEHSPNDSLFKGYTGQPPKKKESYDSFLGFDESYFEI